MMKTVAAALAALLLAACAAAPGPSATPAAVIRHKTPGSDFPIAAAVEVPAGRTTVYVSGAVPPVVDDKADRASPAAYGDTRTQTVGVLRNIERSLQRLGLQMGDVVKMQAFLVGDPAKGGRMDFDGFMAGYREFFGTAAQPHLPARSVMQVNALVAPGWLVEIEVTAVRP
jgi:enamine deaminase RidA (YjgF/YER057c/UK114 family)